MEQELKRNQQPMLAAFPEQLKIELDRLDRQLVEIDGLHFRPSQCYRVGLDPVHVLFNSNCPESLKQKVQAIVAKYTQADENRQQHRGL